MVGFQNPPELLVKLQDVVKVCRGGRQAWKESRGFPVSCLGRANWQMVKLNNNFLVSEFGDDTHIFIHASEIDNMYY